MIQNVSVSVGDFVKPDEWRFGEILRSDDGFSDSMFPGCQFRLPSSAYPDYQFAVNIRVTGKERFRHGSHGWFRCEIEFVGDCADSVFVRGWLHKN